MIAEVVRHLPEESCGLLAGCSGRVELVIPVENQLHSRTGFRMEPSQQVKAFQEIEIRGLNLVGIYHSHPTGPAGPSQTDLDEFAYPGTVYLIWSPDGVGWQGRAFLLDAKITQQISLIVE